MQTEHFAGCQDFRGCQSRAGAAPPEKDAQGLNTESTWCVLSRRKMRKFFVGVSLMCLFVCFCFCSLLLCIMIEVDHNGHQDANVL